MSADGTDPNGDPLLAALYSAFTKSGGELGVTLLLGGSWVTGVLCSPRAWFVQVAHLVDEASDGLGEVFEMVGRNTYPTVDEVEAGVVEAPPGDGAVRFVHMRDARLVKASGAIPSDGRGLLRLRLEEVDGWMVGNLGELGYVPPPPPV